MLMVCGWCTGREYVDLCSVINSLCCDDFNVIDAIDIILKQADAKSKQKQK